MTYWNRPIAVRHMPPSGEHYTFAVVRWFLSAILWTAYGLAILAMAGVGFLVAINVVRF